jgi:hypothetical protein
LRWRFAGKGILQRMSSVDKRLTEGELPG